jgi:PTS system mannose-specific IID component
MTYNNLLLLCMLYYFGSSTSLSLGIGYYTVYRPIVAGGLAGLILGNPTTGLLTGAVINIIYIDFVSTGGSLKGDQCLTAIMGVIIAKLISLQPIEAAALAYPFGYVGILIWKYRLTLNSIFVRRFEQRYDEGLNPDITIYNGILPQILLFLISSVIMILCVTLLFLLNIIIKRIAVFHNLLFSLGIVLILISLYKVLYYSNNKRGILAFIIVLFMTLIINFSSIITLIATLLILCVLLYLDSKDVKQLTTIKNERKILTKGDLFYSWFIWMNFSHSCYSFGRLQGFAFAHSMKNIFKKLYKDKDKISEFIKSHTEFFNTEPNMGTPIHGYIIFLEEQKSMGLNGQNTSYIKKGMMGIAAGLGDSFTQVVLTPLFISLSLALCFGNSFKIAIIPIVLLGITIIYISYTGWMSGYFYGKDSLIMRINIIKNSRIKKYFPVIFGSIIGATTGKVFLLNIKLLIANLLTITIFITITILYVFAKKLRRRNES